MKRTLVVLAVVTGLVFSVSVRDCQAGAGQFLGGMAIGILGGLGLAGGYHHYYYGPFVHYPYAYGYGYGPYQQPTYVVERPVYQYQYGPPPPVNAPPLYYEEVPPRYNIYTPPGRKHGYCTRAPYDPCVPPY